MKSAIENRIIESLAKSGPVTGKRLIETLENIDNVALWRECYMSDRIRVSNCARYYLRYDILRGNTLRLSPSILRDFLTFSVVYLPSQLLDVIEINTILANKFRSISLGKQDWARKALLQLDPDLQQVLNDHCVVFLSGDIAYLLAHETKRVHSQLSVEINGSDIDIVIIANNEVSPETVLKIESQLLKIKRKFLVSPEIGEELDFIVKSIETMIGQLAYQDIHQKIASKILYESSFLMGRLDIYQTLMEHLKMSGTWDLIENDFETALSQRKETISKIILLPPQVSTEDPEVASLFFASKERLEFR